ncbi:MAG: DUF2141 domain-containing protein, partial [Bacteroidota bacterium]
MEVFTQYPEHALSAIRGQSAQLARGTKTLEIHLLNVRNTNGHLLIALFDQQSGFPESFDAATLRMIVPAQPGKQRVTITGLDDRDYALTVFHDENDNGKLDKNALGMPLEGYGVSNNARNRFRAPDWSRAKFRMRDGKKLYVKLAYPV